MNVSLDVLIKEMVRNEVAAQLAGRPEVTPAELVDATTQTKNMLTKIDGEEVVNPVDAEETAVDTSAADQVQADKDAKLAARRAKAAAKKVKDEAAAKAAAEAEADDDDDSELDDDMCSEDDSTELSAVDLLAGVNKAIKSSSLPKAQAKSMAKEVLAEDFGFDKFGEVTADKRAEVLSKVADALK